MAVSQTIPDHCCHHHHHDHDIGYENATFAAVSEALALVLTISQQSNLWRIGDGHGGWLHRELDRIAEQMGLETAVAAKARQKIEEQARREARAAKKAERDARAMFS